MNSRNSTMFPTASRITRSMVPRSLGVSRSLVVLSSLGCYMQEYRRRGMRLNMLHFTQKKRCLFTTSFRREGRGGPFLSCDPKVRHGHPTARGRIYGPAFIESRLVSHTTIHSRKPYIVCLLGVHLLVLLYNISSRPTGD
jgi:hypothetical protein